MSSVPDIQQTEIYKSVLKSTRTIVCYPTWKEFREWEYFRSSGIMNVFDPNILQGLTDLGCSTAKSWCLRCKANRIHPVSVYDVSLKFYEGIHGPRNTWIDDEFREQMLITSLNDEESRLKQQLASIKRQKRLMRKCKST